jgi:hypothetical protein
LVIRFIPVQVILPAWSGSTIARPGPPDAYLGGGTATAVHLGQRISRDLDFFFRQGSVDLDELARRLSAAGQFAVTDRSSGTLNNVFSATKVQFLHADEDRPQHLLEPPTGCAVRCQADAVIRVSAGRGLRRPVRRH